MYEKGIATESKREDDDDRLPSYSSRSLRRQDEEMPDPISLFNGVPKAAAAAKKKKNKTHKKDCSIDLFISQSNGRSIVRSLERLIV